MTKHWLEATVLVCLAAITTYSSPQSTSGGPVFKDGELLVKFYASVPASRRDAILASRSGRRLHHFGTLDIDHVTIGNGANVATAVAALAVLPEVQAVQPNYVRHIVQNAAPPNDPYWLNGTLWGLSQIQANVVWNTMGDTGNGTVVIADIDTGIDYTHPDLQANIWNNPGNIPGDTYTNDLHGINVSASPATGDPMDDNGHGTHTAGTLAAVGNNGIGVVGVNWNAKLLACKFLDSTGSGTDAGAIECFDYVAVLKAGGVNIRVTSNSWGGARSGGLPTALESALDALGDANILNVFAAGNSSTNIDVSPFDPASLSLVSPSVVAVAASDQNDNPASWSNYGPQSVAVAAPGVSITSTYLSGGYASLSGTSMATPHVAGTAALIASIDPSLMMLNLKAAIINNVDVLAQWNGLVTSGGRLNAYKAASGVSVDQPPVVSLTSPRSGASYTAPASIPVTDQASDPDGTVASVTFYANGNAVGTSTAAPFSFTWTNVAAGTYTLTATATDNLGLTGAASAGVTVTVNPAAQDPPEAPTVTITSPRNGTTDTQPTSIKVSVSTSDRSGTVTEVTYYANGIQIGTSAAAPFSWTWSDPAVGTYTLTAVATNSAGQLSAVSPGVSITVKAATKKKK